MVWGIRIGRGGRIIDEGKYDTQDFIDTVIKYEAEQLLTICGKATFHLFKHDLSLIHGAIHTEALTQIAKTAVCFDQTNNLVPGENELVHICNIFNQLKIESFEQPSIIVPDFGEIPLLEYMLKKAYYAFGVQKPLKNEFPRAYYILNELEGENTEISTEDAKRAFRREYGIGFFEYLMLIYFLHLTVTSAKGSSFSYNIFENTKNKGSNIRLFDKVKETVSLPKTRYKTVYQSEKYRRKGYYLTEYNILEDFPIVELNNGVFVAPIYQYLGRKISNKLFFDLLNVYEKEEAKKHPLKPATDNPFSRLMGNLFEQYVKKQLLLIFDEEDIKSNIKYGKKETEEAPDNIVKYDNELYFFEAKIARPNIETMVTGNLFLYKEELQKLAKGVYQALNFVDKYRKEDIKKYVDLGDFHTFNIILVTLEPWYYYHHKEVLSSFAQIVYDYYTEKKRGVVPYTMGDIRNTRILIVPIHELEYLVTLPNKHTFFRVLQDYREKCLYSKLVRSIANDSVADIAPSLYDYLVINYKDQDFENPILTGTFDKIEKAMKAYFFE